MKRVMIMMNYIWAGIMLIAILFGLLNGRISEVSSAVLSGGSEAVQLALVLLGAMAFWSGLMKIADQAGITKMLSRLFYPIVRLLFKTGKDSPATKAITMNITANLLGLGNAATPFGLQAMKEMEKENKNKGTASNAMAMFVVLNTASVQLIPTTIAVLRAKHGAQNPMDIMPAVWLTSIAALIVGVMMAKVLERRR